MGDFVARARFALRLLLRHKRFSTLAIVSLGVAIALNTTMYSVLDTMISPKLAMREPERLWRLEFYGNYRQVIPREEIYRTFREVLTFHEGMTGWTSSEDRYVQRGITAREAQIRTVLPNYFAVTGARPSAGRVLSPTDLTVEGRPVVLSQRMWNQLFPDKERFEPSPIFVSEQARTVVGVLPYEAGFPGQNVDVWQLPLPAEIPHIAPFIARLKPGDAIIAQAFAELEVLRKRLGERTGETRTGDAGFRFYSATNPPFRPWGFHYALIGSVVAVLLVACANLANLQLARGVTRARELATRAAVGASRRDIITQLVLESAWLAFGGLLLGAVLTAWGMRLVDAYVPPQVAEYMTHPQVSWRVLTFAVVVTVVCLTLMGLVPAIRVSRVDIEQVLKSGAGTGKSKSTRRQYGALVVLEVALALTLVCGASLLMRAALGLITYDPGYDAKATVRAFTALAASGPADKRTRFDRMEALQRAAHQVPGVTSASVYYGAVPRTRSVATEEAGTTVEHSVPMWAYQVVSAEYLRTLRLPVVQGRDFSEGEFAEPSVIVSERTAEYLWPGQNPVGRMIKLDSAIKPSPWLRVVGVASSKRDRRADIPDDRDPEVSRVRGMGAVYVLAARDTARLAPPTARRRYSTALQLVVRVPENPLRVALPLRQALVDAGADYAAYPQTWEQYTGIARLRAKHGFMASLFVVFGVMALALAALGVYAIIAHMVAQRTREFGVRIAIGAGVRDIRELVLREGNVLALAGIAVGLLITSYSARWLRAFLFDDYDRYDSRVYAVVSLALFGVAWLASYIPARRAMRINPVEALRND